MAIDPGLEQHFVAPLLAQLVALGSSAQRAVVALNGPVGPARPPLAAFCSKGPQPRG